MNSRHHLYLGNALNFLIYCTDDVDYFIVDNYSINKDTCNIAQDLSDLGVTLIISAKVCKPCYGQLKDHGIEIYEDHQSITIREAFQKLQEGGLYLLEQASNCTCPKSKKISRRKQDQIEKLQ